MKTHIKHLLSALLLLALPAAVHAQFTFTTNNGTLTITGYSGPGGELIIPESTNGIRITAIGNSAFAGSGITAITVPPSITNVDDYAFSSSFVLTNVTLPGSITSIKDGLFLGCHSLTSISIPSSVTSIGSSAFAYCIALSAFTVPSAVTNIGVEAFGYCTKLPAIMVDEQNQFFSSLDGVLFSGYGAALIQCPAGKAGTYTIPNSVTSIWQLAFEGCASLTNVIFPNSVTDVGDDAFFMCTGLQTVSVPTGLTYVGNDMFNSCFSLTNVSLPQPLTKLGWGAFGNCTALKSISIPNAVTNIGSGAFENCTSLTNVNIPTGLTYIAEHTFESCSSLSSVTFPEHLTSIGYNAFSGCSSITNFTIPESLVSIEQSAFGFCTSLSMIAIPASVLIIGNDAFFGCSALMAISVDGANPNYSSVDGVLFSKDQSTLVACPGGRVGSYTVPDTVTTIGYRAFGGCYGLTNITLPTCVTSLQDVSFFYSTNLTGLFFQGNAPTVGAGVLVGDSKLTVYYLPGARLWHPTFGGRPTALWFLPKPLILDNGIGFGPQAGGFGFTISWATNLPVIAEACSNLATHVWLPVRTNNLTNGTCYFSDPDWTSHPSRFYRIRSP